MSTEPKRATLDVKVKYDVLEDNGVIYGVEIVGVTCDGEEVEPPANQGQPWELILFGVDPFYFAAISVSEDHW